MFARARTPRNPSFYTCESPRDSGKYRPQTADAVIYKRTKNTVKWTKSKYGRFQQFILFGNAVCNEPNYDCSGVAALRCTQHIANRRYKDRPVPADKLDSRHVISKSQTQKCLKMRHKSLGLNNPNEKGIEAVPLAASKRSRKAFKGYTKHKWHCAGDEKLLRYGPSPCSYKIVRSQTTRSISCPKFSVVKKVNESAGNSITAIRGRRKVFTSRNQYKNSAKSNWRVSEKTPNRFNHNLFHNSLRKYS